MSTITRRTAQLHCRTCLGDLLAKGGEAYDMEENADLINWLERLLPLVSLYRGEDQADYPHLVCVACYTKLSEFNNFYTSVCNATDVWDRLFAENANKAATATACATDEHFVELSAVEEEYTNGNASTTLEIELLSNTDGESTDTCSETEERSQNAKNAIKQGVQKTEKLENKKMSKSNGKLAEFEHVIVPNNIEKNNVEKTTTIQYIVPLPTVINRKSYKCSKCERKFLDKYSCIMHIRSCQLLGHTDEYFECEICHRNYQKIGHLNRHKLTEHEDLCPLKCEYAGCNFIFRRNIYRQRHYEMFHVNEVKKSIVDAAAKAAQNDECTKAVSTILLDDNTLKANSTADSISQDELEISQNDMDLETELTEDNDATIEEDDDDDIDAETLLTSVTKPYRGNCPICHGQFNLGRDLRMHISNEHPNELKFKCNICNKPFLYQAYLNSHLTSAHGEKKTPCSLCPKMFKTIQELKKHISLVHHGVRPFGCRFCSAKFGVRASRDRHELTHTGEKPYACDLCDRTFSYAHSVRKHKDSHEKGRLKQV